MRADAERMAAEREKELAEQAALSQTEEDKSESSSDNKTAAAPSGVEGGAS